jgi:hypothetical protein
LLLRGISNSLNFDGNIIDSLTRNYVTLSCVVILCLMFNMAFPFTESTKEQERSVIRFFWLEGLRTGEVYGSILFQQGQKSMSKKKYMTRRNTSKEGGGVLCMIRIFGGHRYLRCYDLRNRSISVHLFVTT